MDQKTPAKKSIEVPTTTIVARHHYARVSNPRPGPEGYATLDDACRNVAVQQCAAWRVLLSIDTDCYSEQWHACIMRHTSEPFEDDPQHLANHTGYRAGDHSSE